jgi:hypothetical protein
VFLFDGTSKRFHNIDKQFRITIFKILYRKITIQQHETTATENEREPGRVSSSCST